MAIAGNRRPRAKRVVEFGHDRFPNKVLDWLIQRSEKTGKKIAYFGFDLDTQKPSKLKVGSVRAFSFQGDFRQVPHGLRSGSIHELHFHMLTTPIAEDKKGVVEWLDGIHRVLAPKGKLYLSFDGLFLYKSPRVFSKSWPLLETLVTDNRFSVRFAQLSRGMYLRALAVPSISSLVEKWWKQERNQRASLYASKFSDSGTFALGFIVLQKK